MAEELEAKEPESGHRLLWRLTLLDAVGIGFGAVVGAGIFVVTGVAAGVAGPALLIALVLAGVAASANALSSAQLAARYPAAGGTYEYGYQLISPPAGFAAGWLFLTSKIAAAGTVALGLGAYLTRLFPGLQPRLIAVLAVVLFTALNYFGIQKTSRVNLLMVGLSLGSLLVFVATGLPAIRATNFEPFLQSGWIAVLRASALLFFAYTGYARLATLGEEVREPQATIPRAVIITIVGAMVLYMAVATVAVGSAGAAKLAETDAPLAVAAEGFGLAAVPQIVATGALAAMLGVILSQITAMSRMVFAMARRRDLPQPLAHVHHRRGVPDRAIVLIGTVAAIVTATGSLGAVASAAAFAILLYYGITNMAALRLPDADRRYPRYVAWVGLIACTLLALALSPAVIAIGLGSLAVGLVLRLVVRRDPSVSGAPKSSDRA